MAQLDNGLSDASDEYLDSEGYGDYDAPTETSFDALADLMDRYNMEFKPEYCVKLQKR